MRRVVCHRFSSVDDLVVEDAATPVPGPGEVLVEVAAVGVSFVDGLIVEGRYQVRPPLPFTPGSVAAGAIAAVGPGVTTASVRDRVALLLPEFGAYASQLVVRAENLIAVPDGVSAEVAATTIESYSTALFALQQRCPPAADEWVVVRGAGGGVGLAAVDVSRSLGARVIAVASSEDKRAAALAMGASQAIGYDGIKDAIRTITGGGADIVLDPVGGDHAEPALRALARHGRFCVIGFAAGSIPKLPANVVLLGNRSVIGVDWGDWARVRPAAANALAADVLDRIARGELHPTDPTAYPLAEVGRVLRMFAERTVTGKLALLP